MSNEKPQNAQDRMIEQVGAKEARKMRARREADRAIWFGLGSFGIIGWSVVIPTLLGAHLGVIVFGSNQGLVGHFNQYITNYAINQMNGLQVEQADRTVLAIGLRAALQLEQRGQAVQESLAAAGSVAGITPIVQEIILRLNVWRTQKEVERIILFFNHVETRGTYEPRMVYLLPVDLEWLQELETRGWPTRVVPTFRMDEDRLLAELIREYFFVALYRAAAESLASENSSRLTSMETAEKNIEEHLGELNARFQHLRQSSIEEELLDIMAGFEALS